MRFGLDMLPVPRPKKLFLTLGPLTLISNVWPTSR
jgi:hypothetical protein